MAYYSQAAQHVKHELATELDKTEIRKLHKIEVWKHFVIVGWQFFLLASCIYALVKIQNPLIWIPISFVLGFTIFNFTVLLHEVVHNAVFVPSKKSRFHNRILGLMYAFPSGISATQFTKWHLDHHAGLGSPTEDPKRHHLSPKINKRWVKLLYYTPALFFIYFRAAGIEASSYPPELQSRIKKERMFTILFQFSLMGLCYFLGGPGVLLRVYLVPIFVVFPIAFSLNRLGQHYNIRPEDPAQWSTLVKSSWFWNIAFLYSNFHLEHHYFPGVPFYNLARIHKLLQPFYARRGIKAYSYGELFFRYIILNKKPHDDWEPIPNKEAQPPLAAAAL
jgi:beta-carotene hydroxylase